jgi:ADP-ribose pyrophosphatase YjhB (NUDIX family)
MGASSGKSTSPAWPRAGASAALFRGEEVLLVERAEGPNAGLWSLPGGSIEPGEPAEDAAVREVLEETGLTARIVGLAGVYDIIERAEDGAITFHYVLATYYGQAGDGEPQAGGDARGARFFSPRDLDDPPMTRGARHVIEEARRLLASSDE